MKPNTHGDYLRSAELSRLCGLSTDSLRHYERLGLLHAGRSANGYREYPAQSAARIRLVRRALSVGFTLNELARLLKIRDKGGAPCKDVRALAAAKLKDLDKQLLSLSMLRNELRRMLGQWDSRLAHTRQGEQAGLLDMLADSAPGPEKSPSTAHFGARAVKTSREATRNECSRSLRAEE